MLFSNIRTTIRRWNRIRATRNELNQMSDHELNDIGISRWQINEVVSHTTH